MATDQQEQEAIQRAVDAVNARDAPVAVALALLAIYSVLDDLRTELKRPMSRRR